MNGWVWHGRRQPESAHPLAVLRCFQLRAFWCFNHMAHNSGLSQQSIHSSSEFPCVSYQGTEPGKSRISFCKVFTSSLQCLAQSFLLKSQVFLVFYPKQTPAANCNECSICGSCWGLNVWVLHLFTQIYLCWSHKEDGKSTGSFPGFICVRMCFDQFPETGD